MSSTAEEDVSFTAEERDSAGGGKDPTICAAAAMDMVTRVRSEDCEDKELGRAPASSYTSPCARSRAVGACGGSRHELGSARSMTDRRRGQWINGRQVIRHIPRP